MSSVLSYRQHKSETITHFKKYMKKTTTDSDITNDWKC